MKIEDKLEMWAAVLGFAYDNLSGREFDELLKSSPFSEWKEVLDEDDDPDDYEKSDPAWKPIMETVLFFR